LIAPSTLVDALSIAKSKHAKITTLLEKFTTVARRRRQSGNECRAIPPPISSPGKFGADSLHGREDIRRSRVFAFREREEKVLGKFASFRPRAGRRSRCRLRIDSSKGNSYPLTGRNSLRGEILEPCTHSARPIDFQGARHRGVASRSRPPTRTPKLMPVPRNNLSADPVYYGTQSLFADE